MTSIYNQVIGMQSATAYTKAEEQKRTGVKQELDQDAFLMLMMEQMKHQDPLDPMDNSQMLTQQAQFTQISELQKMNSSIASNNSVMQASSLIGKYVTAFDPDKPDSTISGYVTEANFSSSGVSVVVNGKSYPLAYIFSAMNEKPAEIPTNTDTDSSADNSADSDTNDTTTG